MSHVDVWFVGGPVDGAWRRVPVDEDGQPAQLVMLRGGEVYLGSSDEPAASDVPVYHLARGMCSCGLPWLYIHEDTLGR